MAWYDGLFSSDSGLNDQDKSKLANQGLLQAGLGILAANGQRGTTPFQAIAGGLLGGLGSVQQGAQDIQNNRYKSAIEQSTLSNVQAAQAKAQQEAAQKKALHDALAANTDANGNIDTVKAIQQYGKNYPEDAASALVALHGGKPELKDTPQGALQVYPDGYNAFLQAGGMPQGAPQMAGQPSPMPASIPAPMGAPGGGPAYTPPPPLLGAQATVESGNNPNAVSPAGAIGTMQTLPSTLRDPGFGVRPAQNNSPAELTRVGNDYSTALQNKYGQIGGLAAYNWGPGNWDKALASNGGNVQAALASAPAETQSYVPKVLGAAGQPIPGANPQGANPSQLPPGRISLQMPSKTANADDDKYAKLISLGYSKDQAAAASYGVKPAKQQALDDPQSWDDGLTGDQKNVVQMLANYDIPLTNLPRDPATREMLISRAGMVNPGFKVSDYNQNQQLLKDMASNSPTSAGGTINQAKVVFSHLQDMLDVNSKLPDLPLGIGHLSTKATALWGKGGDAKALQTWNSAVPFLSGEAAKMVKNGVASEAEGAQIQQGLDPGATSDQRLTSLNTMARLLLPRVQAVEAKRDEILGNRSPNTSLLDAASQKTVTDLAKAAGTEVPVFRPPSTSLGMTPKPLMSSPKPNAGWSIQMVSN